MTPIILFLFSMISMLPLKESDNASVKAMTFNIRYGTAKDGDNAWTFRKDMVFEVICRSQCDFIGLQEAMMFQIEEIIQKCPSYEYIGVTRNVDPTKGEASPILFDASRWKLLNSGTHWLSETPEVPGSKSWNSSLPRIFTWGKFQNLENKNEILIFNTHYDHRSAEARVNSSRVIIDYIFSMTNSISTILLGDFNASEDQDPITYLTTNTVLPLTDVYRSLHQEHAEKDMTFYGWKEHEAGTGKRLDYIFYTGELRPLSAEVVQDNIEGRYPSDHMPVMVEFRY
jgi:endonuclease/exonuclease/phosphatase family metal-dependent hydrolase